MPATETTARLLKSAHREPLDRAPEDDVERTPRNRQLPGVSWFVLSGIVILLSAVTTQGADLFWGVAMGDRFRAGFGIPRSIPFAAARSEGWVNPMALGEVLLSAVHSIGPTALVVLHLALVATALGVLLAHGQGRRGEARASVALALATVGGASTLAIARMPSLSLLPYAALVVLLLRNAERPSRQVWLVVPLLALWANLHGGVLVGCALLIVHLICCHGPLRRRALVGLASFAAVLLATSAGWHTAAYYRGVLGNEAAQQHVGLWARPSLDKPFDVLMLLTAVGLITMWLRSRPVVWETVVVVGMASATLLAARNSIWLMLFLVPLAARGRSGTAALTRQRFPFVPLAAALAMTLLGVGWQLTVRSAALDAPGSAAVPVVRPLAEGRTVLAVDPVEETFAQSGIRVWAGNPIDAFPQDVQRQYLAFVEKGTIPRTPRVDLIVVDQKLARQIRAAGWKQVSAVSDLLVFERPSSGPTSTRS